MNKELLALLESKFPGVHKNGLALMAKMFALQVTTIEEAQALVDKLTAEQVTAIVKDYRADVDQEVTKGTKTFEESLKKKFDLIEKGKTDDSKPATETGSIQEQIQKALEATMKPLVEKLQAFEGNSIKTSRRETLVKELSSMPDSYKTKLLKDFERMNFADEQAFADYLTDTQADVVTITQEVADKGLSGQARPVFGAPNKDGISTGVQAYIDAKAKGDDALKGKEV